MRALSALLADSGQQVHGGNGAAVSARGLEACAERIAEQLTAAGVRCAGLRMDNGIDWICADLACQLAGVPVVPLPAFFTSAQVQHVRTQAGMDCVLGSIAGLEPEFAEFRQHQVEPHFWLGPAGTSRVPASTAKVTFTSGTTGKPKGVCLSWDEQMSVASELARRTAHLHIQKHMCVLPLAVLLENVAGVYAAMLSGADVLALPLKAVGVSGSSGFSPASLVEAIRRHGPDSLILLPQMLKALVSWLKRGHERLAGLRFVAVGGARTSSELIQEARALGLPVYEGYGLSECCSVVAVNVPGDDRPGTVGRPLPGRDLRVSPSGEIEVRMAHGVRYLGGAATAPGWIPTGDLGSLDKAGFLHVNGRRKQVLITAFGRNVSPEWVESELLAEPEIMQCVVLGDASPALFALVSPAPKVLDAAIDRAVKRCNQRLPDYARIAGWRRIEPMTPANGHLTSNGRVRRPAVEHSYASTIDALRDSVEAQFSGEPNGVLSATS